MNTLTPPHSLRVEYAQNPIGLADSSPRLSWKLPIASGVSQTAWQIRAATERERLATGPDVFDTGCREGADSVFISWLGKPLKSRSRVFWQVRVWLEGDREPGAWSEIASLETGLLSRDDWTARWIGFGDRGEANTPLSPFLRRGFALASKPVKARLYASALGLFEFHLNGSPIHPHFTYALLGNYFSQFQLDLAGQPRLGLEQLLRAFPPCL